MSQLGIKPRDSFEIGYNRATGLAAAGDLEAAEAAVKAAYKQGEGGGGDRGEGEGRRARVEGVGDQHMRRPLGMCGKQGGLWVFVRVDRVGRE
jgi:hypothetical protein